MKRPDQIDLDGPQRIFAVANTPLFLLRKLRADPEVQRMSTDCDAEDVLDALNAALPSQPQTLEDLVRPYAYLVALSFDQTRSYLERAAKIHAPYHNWFKYIADVLIRKYKVTSFSVMTAPSYLPESRSSFRVSTPEKRSVIIKGTDE